jgi:hypothetical protein
MVAEWDRAAKKPEAITTGRLEHEGDYWRVYLGDENISWWRSRYFPGCQSFVITTDVVVVESMRGKGVGRFLRRLRERAYGAAGFAAELCTVRDDNEPQIKIMNKFAENVESFPSDSGGTFSLYLTRLVGEDG